MHSKLSRFLSPFKAIVELASCAHLLITLYSGLQVKQYFNNGRGSAINRALDGSTYPG